MQAVQRTSAKEKKEKEDNNIVISFLLDSSLCFKPLRIRKRERRGEGRKKGKHFIFPQYKRFCFGYSLCILFM